jgi:hypothetical protein
MSTPTEIGSPSENRIIEAIVRLETKMETLEKVVEKMSSATPPAPVVVQQPSTGMTLPNTGGLVGLIAGALYAYQQLTGKA